MKQIEVYYPRKRSCGHCLNGQIISYKANYLLLGRLVLQKLQLWNTPSWVKIVFFIEVASWSIFNFKLNPMEAQARADLKTVKKSVFQLGSVANFHFFTLFN